MQAEVPPEGCCYLALGLEDPAVTRSHPDWAVGGGSLPKMEFHGVSVYAAISWGQGEWCQGS